MANNVQSTALIPWSDPSTAQFIENQAIAGEKEVAETCIEGDARGKVTAMEETTKLVAEFAGHVMRCPPLSRLVIEYCGRDFAYRYDFYYNARLGADTWFETVLTFDLTKTKAVRGSWFQFTPIGTINRAYERAIAGWGSRLPAPARDQEDAAPSAWVLFRRF